MYLYILLSYLIINLINITLIRDLYIIRNKNSCQKLNTSFDQIAPAIRPSNTRTLHVYTLLGCCLDGWVGTGFLGQLPHFYGKTII